MQNPREGTLRQGKDGGVESSATAAIWLAQDLPSTNEAWQEEDPAVTSMHARTAPAPGLTSSSEIQMASFQVMETVVAKFGVEDNWDFSSKCGTLPRLGHVSSSGGQHTPPSSSGPTCEVRHLLSRCPCQGGKT